MSKRSVVRVVSLALLAGLCLAPAADAQIPLPFFKKKKKPPPPAEQAAPGAQDPAEQPAPGTKPALQTPGDSASAGKAPVIVPQPNPAAAGSSQAEKLSPEERAALQQAFEQALAADASTDTSTAMIQERMSRWGSLMLRAPPPQDQFAREQYQRAVQDLQAAKQKQVEAGKADDQTRGLMQSKIGAARADINAKSWSNAEQNLGWVLERDPNHPEALSLMNELRHAKRLDDIKRQALYIVPVLLILGAGLVLVVRFGARYREERQRKLDELAAKRAAVMQVVDGVGRGKLVTIDNQRAIFKVGAAAGAEGENNDLVLNDTANLISRYHCTLVRRDGDYYLVDASMNGTTLNGKPVKRGEHVLLDDGDEITLAEVSRLKFLHT